MGAAVIVDAVRTGGGARHGALSGWHPADLAAQVLAALATRNKLDPATVDEVLLGCATQVGAQAANLGRNAVLAAGWSASVPATTVDRAGVASQQALHLAAQGVMAGVYDVAIAGGVEVMSLVPLGAASSVPVVGRPFGPAVTERFAAAGGLVPLGVAAERAARHWGFTRGDLDAYAAGSHARAAAAAAAGRFRREVVAVPKRRRDRVTGRVIAGRGSLRVDESVRASTTLEDLGHLLPLCEPDGVVTAGNSAPVGDGAAAVLIMSEHRAAEGGYRPLARVHTLAGAGTDPVGADDAMVAVTEAVLERSGVPFPEIDRIEVHEGFAAGVLGWLSTTGADPAKVNVNGGAIALGHPLGASGARMAATLVHELRRIDGRYGLQVLGDGGGVANALLVERRV